MKLNQKIGEYIRNVRKDKGLTESELAKLIKVSQQQVSRYEKGVATISIEKILNILCILNIPASDFVEKVIIPEQEKVYKKIISDLKNDGAINSDF